MRVSVDRDSPYYSPDAYRLQPFFNGRKLDRCVEADEEGGHATIIHCNSKGRPVVDYSRGELTYVVLHGDVQIRWKGE